jgi:hypothetical protein
MQERKSLAPPFNVVAKGSLPGFLLRFMTEQIMAFKRLIFALTDF